MAYPVLLTKNGAGLAASVKLPDGAMIVEMRGIAAVATALDANVYVSPSPSDVTNAQKVGHLRCPLNSVDDGLNLSPYGIGISGDAYLVADFVDAGTTHEVWVYVQ